MARNQPFLIVTDLDGTLLDHNDYSWSAAEEALAAVKQRQIPLITNTSKTLAESVSVQKRLRFSGPMIFENGAGVALAADEWPDTANTLPVSNGYRIKSFAEPYEKVRQLLQALRNEQRYRFTGFGDMDVSELQEHTGLDAESAAAARQRHYGEPLVWQDSPERLYDFMDRLFQAGLTFTRGGRFLHVMGVADKGSAMRWLASQYYASATTVALGDGENDLSMLQAADIAVLIRSPAHELPSFPCGRQPQTLLIPDGYGPAGWNRAVLQIIEELSHG